MIDRLPPHSSDAERAVLGACLLDAQNVDELSDLVPEDFYFAAHGKIFGVIIDLHGQGKPCDAAMVWERIHSQNPDFDSAYLVDLVGAASVHVSDYAKVIRDKALLRTFIHAATENIRRAYEESDDADTILAQCEAELLAVGQRLAGGGVRSLSDFLIDAASRFDRRSKGEMPGLITGFADFDSATTGLKPQEMCVIAARPSIGKTAFLLAIADHACALEGKAGFVASLEQPGIDLADRMTCSAARIDGRVIRSAQATPEQIAAMMAGHDYLRSNGQLFIDDTPNQTVARIGANARRLKRQHDIAFVGVDYLQLIRPADKKTDRRQQVEEMSRALKQLARELHIPVIVLAQLNRQSEGRADKKPQLHDLKEADGIAADADIVALLHNYVEGARTHLNIVEVGIAKNRNGPKKNFRLTYIAQYMRFENYAHGDGVQ